MAQTRPFTADERQLLKSRAKGIGGEMARSFALGLFFLSGLLFFVLVALWKWIGPHLGFAHSGQQTGMIYAFSFGIAALCMAPAMLKAQKFAKQLTPTMRQAREDLGAGLAEIAELEVTAAYELPEHEDEGTAFFLQLTDNRVLFVQGQDLYDYAHDNRDEEAPKRPRRFPARRVRYISAPKSGVRFALEPAGDYLPPQLLAAKRFKDGDQIPSDGEFYYGSLTDMLDKFRLRQA